jgi:hypothetical protein
MPVTRFASMVLIGVMFGQHLLAQKAIVFRPHKSPTTPQGAEGGFWRSDANFEPILHLKNVLLRTPLTIIPMLYMADGTEYDLAPVHLEPAGVASINIRYALAAISAESGSHVSTYGTVGIRYQWSWPAVLATVQNLDEIQSLTFNTSLSTDSKQAHQTANPLEQRIDGVWWRPTSASDGFVVLFNAAKILQKAILDLTDKNGGSLYQQEVSLRPHQSIMLPLQKVFDLSANRTGGIVIRYWGTAHSLLAFGGLEDVSTGFSSTLALAEYHPENVRSAQPHTVTLDAPGMMVGKQNPHLEFPEEQHSRLTALCITSATIPGQFFSQLHMKTMG